MAPSTSRGADVLIGNGALVHRQLCRQIGGGLAGDIYAWGRTERLNRFTGGVDAKSGAMPGGHLAPSAWVLPKTPGGMSAFIGTAFTVSTGDLNVAAGRNVIGSTDVTVTVNDAQLQLIVSATGEVSVTITLSSTGVGALSGSGQSDVSVTVSDATLGALVDALGGVAVALRPSATATALGWMDGSTVQVTDTLTAQEVATAVWSEVIDGAYTADDVMRILLAVQAGPTSITQSGATVTVTFQSPDAVDRVVADVVDGERTSVTLTP